MPNSPHSIQNPAGLGVAEAAARIRGGTLSPVELLRAVLARIEALEPCLRAWAHLDVDGALATARQREQEARNGQLLGPLHGVPIGCKDIYDVAGLPTAAGFGPFATNVATEDAAAVARLRAAGAVILGKTVTTQFAFADPSPTRNPWDPRRTPGGSSSGSAAAVAARMVPAALGSQTAGSTLRPAAYCGVVGLKPTFGRVSRHGILPLAWSLDHVGIIARCVDDAALLLQVLAGHDSRDPDSADVPVDNYLDQVVSPTADPPIAASPRHRIAPCLLLVEDFLERAPIPMRQHVQAVARVLDVAGADVRSVRLPCSLDLLLALQHVVMQAEATAVHVERLASHPDTYAPMLRAFVEDGQLVPAHVYVRARRQQDMLRAAVRALLEEHAASPRRPVAPSPRPPLCLLTPTISDVAPDLSTTGDRTFQAPWSLIGLPAISLPTGLSEDQLPLAVQLAAAPFEEASLLQAARWCESVLGVLPAPPA